MMLVYYDVNCMFTKRLSIEHTGCVPFLHLCYLFISSRFYGKFSSEGMTHIKVNLSDHQSVSQAGLDPHQ